MKRVSIFLVLALILALCAQPALADKAKVTVTGSATVSVKPDYLTVSLGVQAQSDTVVSAQEATNKLIRKVREALKDAGVADEAVTIGELSVYPQYNYETSPETLTGYNASHQLMVRLTPDEDAGLVIDAALAAGANRLDGLTFAIDDDNAAYDDALTRAIAEAARRAGVAAAAANMGLGELTDLTEVNSYAYSGVMKSAARDSGYGSGEPTDLSGGSVTVQASVTATYEME